MSTHHAQAANGDARPVHQESRTRTCTLCRKTLPLAVFYKRHARCRSCFNKARYEKLTPEKREQQRKYNLQYYQTEGGRERRDRARLKSMYGLTASETNRLLLKQGGACAGCTTPFNDRFRFCVDHDHSTGKVRGLLCRTCNSALGHAKDSPQLLRQLAVYLETAQVQS